MAVPGPNHLAAIEDALDADRTDIASVALVVGASAADLGSPLLEVLDQLERTYAARGASPAYDVAKALAVSWSEGVMAHQHQMSCEDPLTTLSTAVHLRSRLDDAYRGAERDGVLARDVHALVVVDLPRPAGSSPLANALAMLETAAIMRTVYNGDETIAQVTPRRAAALVKRARADRVTLDLLQVLVRRQHVGVAEPRLWLETLPRHAAGIGWLLAELAR